MYPEAKMIAAMKVWKLPAGKEDMLSEMCSSGDYFLEEKIDGAWYQYEKTNNYSYLFGRGESRVTGLLTEKSKNIPHIMNVLDKAMPPNTILIGEIYYPGLTSKDVTTIMGCNADLAVSRQEGKKGLIHYYVHDIIEYNGINLIDCGAEERYNILKAVWNKANLNEYSFLRLAEKVETDLEGTISRILNRGGEGAVLKKRDYPYTPGKRPAWSTIKVKRMDSVDLVCVGFCLPNKEYIGKEYKTWPYWESVHGVQDDTCHYGEKGWKPITKYYYYDWFTAIKIGAYNSDGELVELGTVSSGLTDDIKKAISATPSHYLNRVCSLDCMSIDKEERTLRHPVFKSWRTDKSPSDCIIDEIFV